MELITRPAPFAETLLQSFKEFFAWDYGAVPDFDRWADDGGPVPELAEFKELFA